MVCVQGQASLISVIYFDCLITELLIRNEYLILFYVTY